MPVPCVAVEIAPASVCTSMSPRFSSASPCRCSSSLRSLQEDAGLDLHQAADSRSTSSTPVHALQAQHHAVRAGDVGERVPGGGGPDRRPAAARALDGPLRARRPLPAARPRPARTAGHRPSCATWLKTMRRASPPGPATRPRSAWPGKPPRPGRPRLPTPASSFALPRVAAAQLRHRRAARSRTQVPCRTSP